MKKKVGIFVFLMLFLLINISFISAELTVQEENEKVTLAYECLNDKIDNKDCSRMTTEQAIFSLLAVKRCESKVYEDGADLECWPKNNCDLKTTAQAILALEQVGEDTTLAEEWLLKQNATPTDLEWYLEVDSLIPTSCTTSYGSMDFNYEIDEDKKIINVAGDGEQCLSVSESGYWIRIKEQCYDETFETTCDQDFLTTLLFKKQGLPTVYVLKSTHSENAGGITIEKIDSLCFSNSGIACNYEGSLWASLVLNKQGYDLESFMPYIMGEASENAQYSPEAFLYYLTNSVEYRTQIFQNQISGKWWQNDALNNKYYDTALELYPFQSMSGIEEKIGTKEWLILDVQGEDGCWDSGNIISNAFVLHSIWPEFSGIDPTNTDCVLAGYNCVNSANCTSNNTLSQYTCSGGKVCCDDGFGGGGDEEDCEENGFFCVLGMMNCDGLYLNEYDCVGMSLCCDTETLEKTCSEWEGDICFSNEYCQGGDTLDTFDLDFGESCCLQGNCQEITPPTPDENECENNYGICESSSCDSDYEETSLYSCEFVGDICCMESSGPGPGPDSGSKWWIWVLFILIVIVLAGILFRDKIKMFLMKLNSKKGGKGISGPQRRPGFPPSTPPSGMQRRPPQRRIMPSPGRAPPQRRPVKKPGELNDVLKKLKDMSQ